MMNNPKRIKPNCMSVTELLKTEILDIKKNANGRKGTSRRRYFRDGFIGLNFVTAF
jgi:hypothetical protein